jgi:hypothetical protein
MPDPNAKQMQREMSEATQRARRELKRIAKVIDKLSSANEIDWGNVGDMQHIATQLEQIANWKE